MVQTSGSVGSPYFETAQKHIDHEYIGGALLLGINGICVIAHGGSSALAIENAIRVAVSGVKGDVMNRMQTASQLNSKPSAATIQENETSTKA